MGQNTNTEENNLQQDDDHLSDALREIISNRPAWILRNAATLVAAVFMLIVGWTWNVRYTETLRAPMTIISNGKKVDVEITTAQTGAITFSEGQRIIVNVENDSSRKRSSFDGKVIGISQSYNNDYKIRITLLDDLTIPYQKNSVVEAVIVSQERRLLDKLFLNVLSR